MDTPTKGPPSWKRHPRAWLTCGRVLAQSTCWLPRCRSSMTGCPDLTSQSVHQGLVLDKSSLSYLLLMGQRAFVQAHVSGIDGCTKFIWCTHTWFVVHAMYKLSQRRAGILKCPHSQDSWCSCAFEASARTRLVRHYYLESLYAANFRFIWACKLDRTSAIDISYFYRDRAAQAKWQR